MDHTIALVEGYTGREIEWKKENRGTCFHFGKTSKYFWRQVNGSIPYHDPPFIIIHKCGDNTCSNVDHMFLGTQTDRAQDWWNKIKKGIIVRGQKIREFKMLNKEKKTYGRKLPRRKR